MSTPGIVISRLTASSASAERARSRSMTLRSSPSRSNSFDGQTLVLRQDLVKKPCPSACPAQIGVWAGGDQVAVQDGLDDILQS
jgi:hypothetical protein